MHIIIHVPFYSGKNESWFIRHGTNQTVITLFYEQNTYGGYVTTVSLNETHATVFLFFDFFRHTDTCACSRIKSELHIFCVITPKLALIGLNHTLQIFYQLKLFPQIHKRLLWWFVENKQFAGVLSLLTSCAIDFPPAALRIIACNPRKFLNTSDY